SRGLAGPVPALSQLASDRRSAPTAAGRFPVRHGAVGPRRLCDGALAATARYGAPVPVVISSVEPLARGDSCLTLPAVAAASDAGEWDGYLATHPSASGYHLWRWRHVFERAFGH